MHFPYNRYEKLAEPLTAYYPSDEEELANWIVQTIGKAGERLTQLFERPMPDMEILVVKPEDWSLVPRSDLEEERVRRPYWTDETNSPTLVVPTEIDPTFGAITREKIAFGRLKALRASLERRSLEVEAFDAFVERRRSNG